MFLRTMAIIVLIPFVGFTADFIKGADISWVAGQEKRGIVFQDTLGRTRDILDILKNDYQINTIRLRVFVNPSDDWGNGLCDIDATVAMAKRVKKNGMQLMLTLHYSDSWADPSKQNPPAAWKNFTVIELEKAVYNHTKEVMEALAAEGIFPVLVQIGNETNNGMLWELGKASINKANYARFVTAGNNAVKEISPETKTVVHLSNGFDDGLFRWNIDTLLAYNAKFDIVGMSAYPEYRNNTTVNDWEDFNNDVFTNITSVIAWSKKPVIIAETGMHYTAEEQCRKMIADLLKKMRSIVSNMGLGVLYWEPQAGPNYNRGYNLGAWGADGKPTKALNGFVENSTYVQTNSTFKTQLLEDIFKIANVNGSTIITLSWAQSGSKKYLYTCNGRLLHNNVAGNARMCNISKGTYIVKVHNKNVSLSEKY